MVMNPNNYELPTSAAECGLVCLAAVARASGVKVRLSWLRSRFPPSPQGSSLRTLIEAAEVLGLSARPAACSLSELPQSQLPCILHWEGRHFVVLEAITDFGLKIFDPAVGQRMVDWRSARRAFSGAILEVNAAPNFKRRPALPRLKLLSLVTWSRPLVSTLLITLVLSLVLQAYVIASPLYVKLAVDDYSVSADASLLAAVALGFGVFAAFNAIAELLRGFAVQRAVAILTWDMSRRLFHHLMRLPLQWFQRRGVADALTRFDSLGPIRSLIANSLVVAAIDGLLSITTLVMMFLMSPLLACIALVAVLLCVGLRVATIPLSMRYAIEGLQASIAEQGKRLETIQAMQAVKAMNAENWRSNVWADSQIAFIAATQKGAAVQTTTQSLQHLFTAVAVVLLIYVGAQQIIGATLTVGTLYAFLAYQSQFTLRSLSLVEQLVTWRLLEVHAFRLSDIVLAPVEAGYGQAPSMPPDGGVAMEAEGIALRYDPTGPVIFKNVSFTLPEGGCLVVTGSPGSGKSSLLKVLAGLYPASAGEIRVNGASYTSIGGPWAREAIGAVFQDDTLLSGTIAENVAFFHPAIDLDRVWRCLAIVGLADEIRRRSLQLASAVGDFGAGLSAHERDRLLLARALYKQPRFLVLDECLPSLGFGPARAVHEAVAAEGITRIIATQRTEVVAAPTLVLNLDGETALPVRQVTRGRHRGLRPVPTKKS